ncbi:MAG: hypothetical protein Q4B26_02245 [Eubacteriales bacterium]|nr:hypothetical protein [Eubacteriales bacterium]
MERDEAIFFYENAVLNKSSVKIINFSDDSKKEYAIHVIRYAIGSLLNWTPEEAYEHITYDLIKMLRLNELITDKYIYIPRDVDLTQDPEYLVYLAFSNEGISFDWKRQTMRVYTRIMKQEIENLPKKFFRGDTGEAKACFLLRYVISQEFPEASSEKLYEFFGTHSKAQKFLKEHHLEGVLDTSNTLYITPLNYLHATLPADRRSEFLYHFWEMKDVLGQTK